MIAAIYIDLFSVLLVSPLYGQEDHGSGRLNNLAQTVQLG